MHSCIRVGAYSTFSLSAIGQWQEAKNHLATIRQVFQLVNGATGKVLHEIVTDGSIYFGINAQNGDVNETAEFATAVATLWRWSGDGVLPRPGPPACGRLLNHSVRRKLYGIVPLND
jgi:hypothetical protein